jgi:hypothetical protein
VSFWDKLEAVPNWVLYVLVILAMAYPIFRPLGLPIVVGGPSQEAYRTIDATPEGTIAVFHIAYGAGGKPTLQPAAVAMSHHLFEKNLKVIYFCDNAVDLANIWGIFDEVGPDTRYGKQYGSDYVVLSLTGPFLTQAAVVLSNLLETIPTDARGQSLSGMPMFQGYTETEDINVVCQLTTSGDISEGWVYQAVSRYERRLVGGWLSMMTSSMIPYYQAGQIQGFIDGSKGAADYEVLANKPGEAVKITDILSLTQVVYLLFIIIGNVGYFGKKYMGGGK